MRQAVETKDKQAKKPKPFKVVQRLQGGGEGRKKKPASLFPIVSLDHLYTASNCNNTATKCPFLLSDGLYKYEVQTVALKSLGC